MRLKYLSVVSEIEWDATELRDYSVTVIKGSSLVHYIGVRIAIESLGDMIFYFGMNRDDGKLDLRDMDTDMAAAAKLGIGIMDNDGKRR